MTGILINEAEAAVVRKKASKISSAMTVEECEKAIEESRGKGVEERTKFLHEALEALPKD